MLGRLVKSTPSRCAAWIAAATAASRSGRRSATRGSEAMHEATQGELVAERAEAAENGGRARREGGVPALRLACVDVRHVHLDERNLDRREGVAQGQARVTVGAGVHDRARGAAA